MIGFIPTQFVGSGFVSFFHFCITFVYCWTWFRTQYAWNNCLM